MEEIARERYQIESGTGTLHEALFVATELTRLSAVGSHPELLHLMHLVEQRRHARLEMARKTLGVSDESHTRQSEGQYHGIWYDWTACRYATSNAVMTEANHNRRRLDREKRAIERPRVEDLSSVLRLHAPPAHLYQERKATLAYGLDYAVEFDLHDSLYKRQKRGAVGLDREEIMYDLQRSGVGDIGRTCSNNKLISIHSYERRIRPCHTLHTLRHLQAELLQRICLDRIRIPQVM